MTACEIWSSPRCILHITVGSLYPVRIGASGRPVLEASAIPILAAATCVFPRVKLPASACEGRGSEDNRGPHPATDGIAERDFLKATRAALSSRRLQSTSPASARLGTASILHGYSVPDLGLPAASGCASHVWVGEVARDAGDRPVFALNPRQHSSQRVGAVLMVATFGAHHTPSCSLDTPIYEMQAGVPGWRIALQLVMDEQVA